MGQQSLAALMRPHLHRLVSPTMADNRHAAAVRDVLELCYPSPRIEAGSNSVTGRSPRFPAGNDQRAGSQYHGRGGTHETMVLSGYSHLGQGLMWRFGPSAKSSYRTFAENTRACLLPVDRRPRPGMTAGIGLRPNRLRADARPAAEACSININQYRAVLGLSCS